MKKITILLLICSLSGCIGLHMLYTRMHIYAVNKLDDNFNLTRPQKEFIRNSVISYQVWQKKSELNLYRGFLNDVKEAVNRGATPDDVNLLWNRLFQLYDRSARFMMPDIITFMKKLDKSQIEFYMKKRSESDRKKRLFFDYPDDEYSALSHASQIRRLEKYFGPFSDSQIIIIKRIYDYDKTLAVKLMEDDINARKRFSHQMIYMRNNGYFETWVRTVFLDFNALYDGDEIKRREIYQEKQKRRLYELLKILTPGQKVFFSSKVDELISEIEKIEGDQPQL
ncbi:MAG: hypothetical protein JW982_12270 [Spirochaetes bacterium]|nr:hypothetical protein [Spirochaetota bacterium]